MTQSGHRREPWTPAALAVLGALALQRLLLLFASPIELYPDEAQYWTWSRTLDWGYFSKPPMIAWLIAATTAVGGNEEAWVRLPGWICQTVAGAFVFLAGRRLYDARTGFWAAVIYALAPGVLLSSVVAATDAPLLMFLAIALWAYAGLLQERRLRWALLVGGAVGFATLSKYAAAYTALGLIAHALASAEARRAWSVPRAFAAVAVFAACLAPNVAWNALNGLETVRHTAGNANWSASDLFNPGELVGFIGAQFGVFGPLPFAALLTMGGVALWRRRAPEPERALWCLLLPPLLLVAGQALLSRANANWAAAFMPPAAVLVGAALSSGGGVRRLALGGAMASQLAFTALATAAAVSPVIADAIGLANGLKRSRGWAATAEALRVRAAEASATGDLSAIAVDDRFLFNAVSYYGRDWLARPGAPPLLAWVREVEAQSEAETSRPLTAARGTRVLAVNLRPEYRAQFRSAFSVTSPGTPASVPLDRRRTRDFETFVGERFLSAPASRPTEP